MSLKVNSLSTFTFLYFNGVPATWRQRVERIEIPGRKGSFLRSLGKTSGPWTIETCKDVLDIDAGIALLKQYAALVGTNGHTLIWRGHDYSTDNLLAKVLDVQGESSSVVQWSGAASSTNKAKLVASWTLEWEGPAS